MALDHGSPSALTSVLSPNVRNNFQVLDAICRPYTYRAHYIETIVERPDNHYEAWVRVLFKPLDERAYVLTFQNQGGSFVLDGIADPPQNWFGPQMAQAEEISRNFVYALGAGKNELAMSYLAPGLISRVNSAEVLEHIRTMGLDKVERGDGDPRLESYKGLKIRTCPSMFRPSDNFWGAYMATLLFDSVDGELKIVSWAKGCYFMKDVSTEVDDPDLEARTLKRFHQDVSAEQH